MVRSCLLFALLSSLALSSALAQPTTCNLQIHVTCPRGSSTCTSTTLNAGQNVCSGQFATGYYILGEGKIGASSNSLGLKECFDSSAYPQPGVAYAFCFGNASLAPGGSFTATASITGGGQVLGITAVYDEKFVEKALVFAQADASAPTCTPVISSPPVTQSGLSYEVSWTIVLDPTAQYIVEESTSPDFSANLTQTQVNGLSKTYRHDVSTTTIYYYRVRATNCGATTPAVSGTSITTVQAPPPPTSRNPEVTVPLGTTQPVSIKVFIPGSASGTPTALGDPAFTASTDKPYLTVTLPSGTILPGGTTVTVTAAPRSLPAGASTGTLTVTTNGTQKTNTPISINLVTPVAPAGKTTPPPNALIIPVVTHVNAAAGPFLSDVRLTNAGGQPSTYQITLTPTRTDGTTSSKVTVITVGAQETTALNDIVKNSFGFGATGASTDVGFGSLEIRPIDSGSLATFAASRLYAIVAGGTLGQYIAAVPFAKFATNMQSAIPIPGAGTSHIRKLSLQQVAHSSRFRTNFGLAEGAGQPASGIVRIFDAAGTNLKEVPFTLLPGEQQQLNGFISANGIPTLTDGRLEVEITSPTGAVTAYASVIDNVTTDPLAVTPVNVDAVSSTRYIVPGIADLNNGASNFHSDVRVFNGGASDVVATLNFYPIPGLPGAAPKQLTIRRGEMAVLDNILPAFFNVGSSGGSVVVTTASPSSLVATARTYTNVAKDGTYGQFIPGVTPPDGVANGDRPLQVLQLEQSDRFRSNLGLVELTGNPVTVHVSLYMPDSKITPSIDVPLAANEFRQLNGVIAQFLGKDTQTYNARISIQVIDGTGRVSAYGSVIDNQSSDPTYVPAQ
ncbi:MAG: hypothetical protein NVSMB68_00740 [Thermoanaerobaculia bacterium]